MMGLDALVHSPLDNLLPARTPGERIRSSRWILYSLISDLHPVLYVLLYLKGSRLLRT